MWNNNIVLLGFGKTAWWWCRCWKWVGVFEEEEAWAGAEAGGASRDTKRLDEGIGGVDEVVEGSGDSTTAPSTEGTTKHVSR